MANVVALLDRVPLAELEKLHPLDADGLIFEENSSGGVEAISVGHLNSKAVLPFKDSRDDEPI